MLQLCDEKSFYAAMFIDDGKDSRSFGGDQGFSTFRNTKNKEKFRGSQLLPDIKLC